MKGYLFFMRRKFIEDCLDAHNRYRAIHGSEPLQILPKLNKYANVWATYLAKKGDTTRRKTLHYGENVYVAFIGDVSSSGPVVEAVDSWYQENKYYEYEESQVNLKAVRHFTQLVWKETKFMGFGMVTSPTGQIYIVCNYDPPGNVEKKFAENVLPPKEQEEQEEKKEEEEEEKEEVSR
ncbi:ectin [Vespa crabro]|uniref:ectin n=1 Tax=Vespa crabro TaxID=7445 RepID=UPI001F02664B|nr:ectin [Vespa crabro]